MCDGGIVGMKSQFLAVDAVAHVDLQVLKVKLVIQGLKAKQDRRVPMDHKVCQVVEVIPVAMAKRQNFTFKRVLKDKRAFLVLLANQV